LSAQTARPQRFLPLNHSALLATEAHSSLFAALGAFLSVLFTTPYALFARPFKQNSSTIFLESEGSALFGKNTGEGGGKTRPSCLKPFLSSPPRISPFPLNSSLTTRHSPLSLVESALPQNASITLLQSALPNSLDLKPCRIRTSRKTQGVGAFWCFSPKALLVHSPLFVQRLFPCLASLLRFFASLQYNPASHPRRRHEL
jgi:hypothetical protein